MAKRLMLSAAETAVFARLTASVTDGPQGGVVAQAGAGGVRRLACLPLPAGERVAVQGDERGDVAPR
jgi:hypothetical protein